MSDTIDVVKARIHAQESLPDQTRFIYVGALLEDGRTLQAFWHDMIDTLGGSTVQMVHPYTVGLIPRCASAQPHLMMTPNGMAPLAATLQC